jgi:small subunit ribosomal protein S1
MAEAAYADEFESMLEESFGQVTSIEGSVVKGIVVEVENDHALIDVGLKSEGRVALKEFAAPGQKAELKPGDEVEVYVERLEDRNGEAMLSRDKARREEAWAALERAFNDNERVTGVIFSRVKGGFTVDLSGAAAFCQAQLVGSTLELAM